MIFEALVAIVMSDLLHWKRNCFTVSYQLAPDATSYSEHFFVFPFWLSNVNLRKHLKGFREFLGIIRGSF